jgi:hypothetical protein
MNMRRTARPHRALLSLALLLLAVPASAVESWVKDHPLRRIERETLAYEVSSWKGSRLFTIDLGTATFRLFRETVEGKRHLVIQADAVGGAPGYPYDATITSRLRDEDYSQVLAKTRRTLPDYKTRLMQWNARGIDLLKHKHCDVPTLCHNPDHFITQDDGTTVHCKGCNNPEHYVWSMRERHRQIYGRVNDIIAALYLARGLDIELNGGPQILRVLNNRDLYDIYFQADKEVPIEVPAGRIPCYRLNLKVVPRNEHAREHEEEFEGPFGLHGQIDLYVDKDTKQVVYVKGQVKLGATFDVEIKLLKRNVQTAASAETP